MLFSSQSKMKQLFCSPRSGSLCAMGEACPVSFATEVFLCFQIKSCPKYSSNLAKTFCFSKPTFMKTQSPNKVAQPHLKSINPSSETFQKISEKKQFLAMSAPAVKSPTIKSPTTPKPKNQVRIGGQKSKFIHADQVKNLLIDGQKEVSVIAYSASISDAIAVVEMLKAQKLVRTTKIQTSTAENGNECIEMVVEKDIDFDSVIEKQQAERENKANN